MITHPSAAGAALLAGLIVAGGSYAARHDLGLGDGLATSAEARARLAQELSISVAPRRSRLLAWQAPPVPHIRARPPVAVPAPQLVTTVVPATSAPAPTTRMSPTHPVTRTSPTHPVTRTSPAGGDDGSGGGDD